MIDIAAFLGGSDEANNPFWGIYFLILFLVVAIPIAVIAGLVFLLFRSFRKKSTSSNTSKRLGLNATPLIFTLAGAIFIYVNIEGSKYSARSIVLDSILLALPFLFGALATLHKFSNRET